jgi:cytochrome c
VILKYINVNIEILYKIYIIRIFAILVSIFLLISCSRETEQIVKPEESRFTKIVLAEHLGEVMQFDVLEDGRVIFVERRGKVRVYDPRMNEVRTIADIPVSIGYYDEEGNELASTGEDGMQGVILDPDFETNNWIYLFYSPEELNSGTILARYEWAGGSINMESEKILLEVPNQRQSCCHLGGGMVFDADGNLYLSTGDNTSNDTRMTTAGFAPLDERPGRSRFDAQRTSGNTNDLRGKILRIRPESDGTYSIPEGNLFDPGTPNTRPEIYTMGNRNPWRLSIDSKTGWLYWGEVGPHGTIDSVGLGPKSYDEFNRAKEPENSGWPYFLADNKAYYEYDYETGESGDPFNPESPVNNSPNNTGLTELPPAKPALIWYPQTSSVDFPIPGSGSNSAVGGPIYRRSDFTNPDRPFPAYYEGKWFVTDWVRGWILVISMDEEGNYKSMEHFLPDLELSGPIDMKFGPDGDLYVLEYGRGVYRPNEDARLIRIEYNDGNRAPIVNASTDRSAGAVPLEINLSSEGTYDYDGDRLSYEWRVVDEHGNEIYKCNDPYDNLVLENPGIYKVYLRVSDSHVTVSSDPITVIAGNEPPEITIDLHGANRSFFTPGDRINYSVDVYDKEDGSLREGTINPSEVAVSAEFTPISETDELNTLYEFEALIPTETIFGRKLITDSGCETCHRINEALAGPSFIEIAEYYNGNEEAFVKLSNAIISGSSGIWGNVAMPPHPSLSESEVQTIVNYILNIDEQIQHDSLPIEGKLDINIPEGMDSDGFYVIRASYTDRGTQYIEPLTSVEVLALRDPNIFILDVDEMKGMEIQHQIMTLRSTVSPNVSGAYLKLNNIDLTNVYEIQLIPTSFQDDLDNETGWSVEVRIGSEDGEIIGNSPANFTQVNDEYFAIDIKLDSMNRVNDVYIIFKKTTENNDYSTVNVNRVKFIYNTNIN